MKSTNKIKCVIEKYWQDNTRVFPNIKDVLKGKIPRLKDHQHEHPKHVLDMIETLLYKKYINDNLLSTFNISKVKDPLIKC